MSFSRWHHAALVVVVAVVASSCQGYRSELGDRCRGELAPGTGRPGVDTADVPETDRSAAAPIPSTPGSATETTVVSEAPAEVRSAAVYGAPWCGPCQTLLPIIERLKAEGHLVEYRNIDKQPTKAVTVVPTVFTYVDRKCVGKFVGPAACKQALEKHFDTN